jgi:hypothetical protein
MLGVVALPSPQNWTRLNLFASIMKRMPAFGSLALAA